jgi:hypothetical protein
MDQCKHPITQGDNEPGLVTLARVVSKIFSVSVCWLQLFDQSLMSEETRIQRFVVGNIERPAAQIQHIWRCLGSLVVVPLQ